MNELFPGKNHEQELPPYSVRVINVQELSPEEREYWHSKGVEFLKDLDNESFVTRFGQDKPKTDNKKAYDEFADRFLKNSKRPHFMVVITSDNTQEILASASLFKLKRVPNCVEIAYTSKIKKKGLGTELIKNAKEFLIENEYSHVYGFFQVEGSNIRIFNRIIGENIAGNPTYGYYWRLKPEDELTVDQLTTDQAIRAVFNIDIDEFNAEDATKNQRRKRRTKLINIIYKFIKNPKKNMDEV